MDVQLTQSECCQCVRGEGRLGVQVETRSGYQVKISAEGRCSRLVDFALQLSCKQKAERMTCVFAPPIAYETT